MLKKTLRLKKTLEINNVFTKGDTFKGSSLICKYVKNQNSKTLFAVSVSKKLKLNAPTRNRLKRQITHAYKEIFLKNEIPYSLNFNFFIILQNIPTKKPRYTVFKEDFQKLLAKLNNE